MHSKREKLQSEKGKKATALRFAQLSQARRPKPFSFLMSLYDIHCHQILCIRHEHNTQCIYFSFRCICVHIVYTDPRDIHKMFRWMWARHVIYFHFPVFFLHLLAFPFNLVSSPNVLLDTSIRNYGHF